MSLKKILWEFEEYQQGKSRKIAGTALQQLVHVDVHMGVLAFGYAHK